MRNTGNTGNLLTAHQGLEPLLTYSMMMRCVCTHKMMYVIWMMWCLLDDVASCLIMCVFTCLDDAGGDDTADDVGSVIYIRTG